MKYMKMLGLLAVAVAALSALAATASAATITSPTGTVYTGKITAESHSPVTSLDGAFITVECKKSHFEGTITSHGSGVTVKGTVNTLSFAECNFPVSVKKGGEIELHAIKSNTETCTVAEGDICTGTLTSTGAEVSIETSVGTCVFTTNATHIGELTPTPDTKSTSTFDIASAKIPRTGGNFLCGSSGTWTGSYSVSTPMELWIDE